MKRNSEIYAYYKYGSSFEMINGKYILSKLLQFSCSMKQILILHDSYLKKINLPQTQETLDCLAFENWQYFSSVIVSGSDMAEFYY